MLSGGSLVPCSYCVYSFRSWQYVDELYLKLWMVSVIQLLLGLYSWSPMTNASYLPDTSLIYSFIPPPSTYLTPAIHWSHGVYTISVNSYYSLMSLVLLIFCRWENWGTLMLSKIFLSWILMNPPCEKWDVAFQSKRELCYYKKNCIKNEIAI